MKSVSHLPLPLPSILVFYSLSFFFRTTDALSALMTSVYFAVEKRNHGLGVSSADAGRRGGRRSCSQTRDHHPVGRGHVSVSRAGPRAVVGAGTAGVNPPYGRQVRVVEDGQLQGQPALYAARGQREEQGRYGVIRTFYWVFTPSVCPPPGQTDRAWAGNPQRLQTGGVIWFPVVLRRSSTQENSLVDQDFRGDFYLWF